MGWAFHSRVGRFSHYPAIVGALGRCPEHHTGMSSLLIRASSLYVKANCSSAYGSNTSLPGFSVSSSFPLAFTVECSQSISYAWSTREMEMDSCRPNSRPH